MLSIIILLEVTHRFPCRWQKLFNSGKKNSYGYIALYHCQSANLVFTAALLFNIYTNDQPIHPGTRSFVYADDLAVTTQSTEFAPIEETLTSALVGLSEYYTSNQLRANPTKTQVSLFHLRNRECGKQLKIS